MAAYRELMMDWRHIAHPLSSEDTVLREHGFRFFFYADDKTEPRHMDVQREARTAKFWLEPIECERSSGFSRSELMDIYRLIAERRELLLQKWNDFFGE